MKKKIIFGIGIIILLLIPLFILNNLDNKPIKKNIKETTKKEDNIIIKEERFKYITSKYDNINEYIKEEEREEEKIIYVCINEE